MLKRIVLLAIVTLNIGCDQIFKGIVRKNVSPMEYIQVVNDNFILTNVSVTLGVLLILFLSIDNRKLSI